MEDTMEPRKTRAVMKANPQRDINISCMLNNYRGGKFGLSQLHFSTPIISTSVPTIIFS